MSAFPELSEEDLQAVYAWVDEIPLSRPKKNIASDFSDGVLCAEIVKHYVPKMVELHNYSSANGVKQKLYNWQTLNQKIFRKLNFQVPDEELNGIVNRRPYCIERLLIALKTRIAQYKTDPKESKPKSSPVQEYTAPAPAPAAAPAASSPARQARPARGPVRSERRTQADSREVDTQLLMEKENTILELRESIDMLEEKVRTLEQLVRLKDPKIQDSEMKSRRR